ncbi:MAG TPA: hypothetical protein VMD91_14005 [Candidatus Sulfotelmatobacter sp.]|nr:hypothetical protein [Candidatus Sulfotelmatobacter sp.]
MIDAIAAFVRALGLPMRFGASAAEAVMAGVALESGTLVVDRERVQPGDVLHEAAHLALLPAAERPAAHGRLDSAPAEEMAALAWSYAAAVRLGIDANVVFHEHGYRGAGTSIAEAFARGGGPGVPLLVWLAMCEPSAFPVMRAWLNPGDRRIG